MGVSPSQRYVAMGMMEGSISVFSTVNLKHLWQNIGAHRACYVPDYDTPRISVVLATDDGGALSADRDGEVKCFNSDGLVTWHIGCGESVIAINCHDIYKAPDPQNLDIQLQPDRRFRKNTDAKRKRAQSTPVKMT